MMKKDAKQLIFLGLFGIFFMSNSYAACNARGLNCKIRVSAVIERGCVVSQDTENVDFGVLDFGVYHQSESGIKKASLTQNRIINFKCTPGTQLEMRIDKGEYYQNSHRMKLDYNDEYIAYKIFQDAAMTKELLSDAPLKITPDSSGDLSIAMFGELDLQPEMRAGVYRDKITITITY